MPDLKISWENQIKSLKQSRNKALAVLIDPDLDKIGSIDEILDQCVEAKIDFIFMGGSLISEDRLHYCIQKIKNKSSIPVIIFPGSVYQIHHSANVFLLLSLVSGRNADFIIGRQVEAAPLLKNSGLEIVSCAYILVDGGKSSSTSYISQTQPIPRDKADLCLATALASEMLGLKCIYLESGSGALFPVSSEMISAVCNYVKIPVMVGGGIQEPEDLKNAYQAGADLVVVGTAFEKNPQLISSFCSIRNQYNLNKNTFG